MITFVIAPVATVVRREYIVLAVLLPHLELLPPPQATRESNTFNFLIGQGDPLHRISLVRERGEKIGDRREELGEGQVATLAAWRKEFYLQCLPPGHLSYSCSETNFIISKFIITEFICTIFIRNQNFYVTKFIVYTSQNLYITKFILTQFVRKMFIHLKKLICNKVYNLTV
jgi:hypothetical protein